MTYRPILYYDGIKFDFASKSETKEKVKDDDDEDEEYGVTETINMRISWRKCIKEGSYLAIDSFSSFGFSDSKTSSPNLSYPLAEKCRPSSQ